MEYLKKMAKYGFWGQKKAVLFIKLSICIEISFYYESNVQFSLHLLGRNPYFQNFIL